MSDCEDYGDSDGYDSPDAYMSQDAGTQDTDDSDPDEGEADYGNVMLSGVEAHGGSKREQYRCLDAEQVLERQREAVRGVTQVLQVTPDDATQLLRAHKWNVNAVNDTWFGDEDAVREKFGLEALESALESAETNGETNGVANGDDDAREVTCAVCYDEFPATEHTHVGCEHNFCATCWSGYLENAVSDGPTVLDLRCPQDGCKRRVPEPMAKMYLREESVLKLDVFKWRSWVDDNPRVKWCTGAGCEVAVLCDDAQVSSSGGRGEGRGVDVHCDCGASFCWSCQEDAHRPVDCDTVRKWLVKNSAESENLNWILANTKPCPACKRPIEKSSGCMHMTCAQCKYDFCWMCSGKWSEHGERTGGYYACNKYSTSKEKEGASEDEKRRLAAKQSIERYTHYYERWAAHGASQTKAAKDLDEMREAKIMRLGDLQNTPVSQLKFVLEAMEQIAECRRVLKWTYGYGYYWMEEDSLRKNFFEYIQGDAESTLELLTEAVEKDLEEFFTEEKSLAEFGDFRGRLTGLTTTVKKYFTTMVTELEAGLPGVGSEVVRAVSLAANPAEEDPPKPRSSARLA